MPQLLLQERKVIDKMVRSDGKQPAEACKTLQKARARKDICGPSKQSVYNYVHGLTHADDVIEARGAKEERRV